MNESDSDGRCGVSSEECRMLGQRVSDAPLERIGSAGDHLVLKRRVDQREGRRQAGRQGDCKNGEGAGRGVVRGGLPTTVHPPPHSRGSPELASVTSRYTCTPTGSPGRWKKCSWLWLAAQLADGGSPTHPPAHHEQRLKHRGVAVRARGLRHQGPGPRVRRHHSEAHLRMGGGTCERKAVARRRMVVNTQASLCCPSPSAPCLGARSRGRPTLGT